MNTPLVSIVVPVYNVEPYINKFLESVLNQTYKNLEIICINDGSTDGSGDILDEFAAKDSRLAIIHQSNAGCAIARNIGLDHATGDYIGFVDPDDWVELNFYEKAVKLAEETHADIVITNFIREYTHSSEVMINYKSVPDLFYDNNDAFQYGFEADVYRGFKMFLWNKLFISRLFTTKERNGLELRTMSDLVSGSDIFLTSQCFLNAGTFAYTNDAFYHYRIRDNSAMRSNEFARRVGSMVAQERIVDMLIKHNLSKDAINLVKRFHTYYCSQLAEFAFSINEGDNLEYSKENIRKYLKEYIDSNSEYPERIERIYRILDMKL